MISFGRRGTCRPIERTGPSRRGLASLGVAWLFLPFHLGAQDPASPTNPNAAGPDSTDRETARSWRRVGLGAGVMGGALLLDQSIRDLALDHQGAFGRDLAEGGHTWGDWKRTAPFLAGGGILAGLTIDGEAGVRRATSAFFGVFAGSISNTLLNWTLGRSRPRSGKGVLHFDPFRGNASLGSGHAAYTFAVAAAVDEVTEGAWAIPFYVAAAGTGLARIYGDRHWLSDVLVGGFIGWWVGGQATGVAATWLGVDATPVSAGRSPPAHPRLRPLIQGDAAGVQIRFRE